MRAIELIILPRRHGKTAEIIKIANKEWLYIVCCDRKRVEHISKMAKNMGLDIPYPVSLNELPLRSQYIKKVLVDDADDVLRNLIGKEIRAISMTKDESVNK